MNNSLEKLWKIFEKIVYFFIKKIYVFMHKDLEENAFNIIMQFIKFVIVGLSNMFVFLIVYYVFIFINQSLYIIGNTLGFIASVLNAYYWNKKYVFHENRDESVKPLIKSFIAYGITFILNTILLYAMVNYLNISKIIAPIICILITTPINFVINKFWTFK